MSGCGNSYRILFHQKLSKSVSIFRNEYSENSPVEGAHQCIMANRESGSVQKEIPARWNFNPAGNVIYDMLIQVCKG